ncbi:ABC transporter ATP-binding protein [Staphylococcus pseudintermedius]|nr:ABC transporter ATP-binding protein [Staphylococcus pseudintermedius]HDT9049440.1 ABC transporter ATP-binding protein [Staphylococcus pseudintermedius]
MGNIFEINDVSKTFGKNKVLDAVDLSVNQGEIVGLLGLNGQGKSTLIKIVLGLLKQNSGKVIKNIDFKQQCGVVLQEVAMPEKMKVKEWLELLKSYSEHQQDTDDILKEVDLVKEKNQYCTRLSGGQKRRLQYAVALVNCPQFLVLDEPTTGMDVASKELFWEHVRSKVEEEKMSVLLISHDLEEIAAFATRIVILHKGKIVLNEQVEVLFNTFDHKGDKLKKIFKEKVLYEKG